MIMRLRKLTLVMALMMMSLLGISQPVTITPPEAHIEMGESVTLTAAGAIYYQWAPASGLSTTEGPVTVASPRETTTYTCTGFALGAESVVNGNFDQGNFGFTSDYQYSFNLWDEGTYYVDYDASLHHESFQGLGYGGNGNFMIVNGATTPGTNVWTEQIMVQPDTYYAFSTWVCTVSAAGDAARLQFCINGNQLGDVFSAPPYIGQWLQFYELWYSGNSTSASITILNQNTVGSGNDFGLDNISFCELVAVGEPQCTVYVGSMTASAYADETELCEGASTTLHAQASGGTTNYTYSWTPANSLDNPNVQNPVATPSVGTTTYTCHVSDGNTTQDVEVTIVVHPNREKTLNVSICENDVYDFFGEELSLPGEYTHHLQTQFGCDSLITLLLAVDEYQMPPVVNQYECYAYGTTPAWYWDKTGITYHNDAYDEILLDDPNGGCPILHRLDLKFHEEYYHEENKVACGEYYWPVTGVTYQQSQDGITASFHHAFGDKECDSIYVLNLTIADYETNEFTIPEDETCDGYYWNPQGHAYSTNDAYDPDDHYFTVSGTYERTYRNQMDCDSIVTIHLDLDYIPHPSEICPMDPDNTSPHNVITATEFQINSYDYYLWETNPDCHWDTVTWNFVEPTHWVLEPFGDKGSCCKMYVIDHDEDTVWLEAHAFNRCAPADGIVQRYWFLSSFYGIDESQDSHSDFVVTPNPNNGQMTLRFEGLTGKIEVKVFDMRGNIFDNIQIYNGLDDFSLQYDMKGCANGIYCFVVRGKEGVLTKKVIINQ